MATALDIVRRSMRLVGALGGGETPTDTEQTDGIAALNSMLDAWGVQANAIYMVQDETFTWAATNATRTMGSGGDFDTVRPIFIEGMFQRQSSIDYPIQKATEQQYAAIPDKDTSSTIIYWIYPDSGYPLTTLYAFPVPSVAASVHIRSHKPLQSFTAATTALAMPQGYQDALEFNLAVILAAEYGRDVRPHVAQRARATLRAIKVRNHRMPTAVIEPALGGGRVFDINRG